MAAPEPPPDAFKRFGIGHFVVEEPDMSLRPLCRECGEPIENEPLGAAPDWDWDKCAYCLLDGATAAAIRAQEANDDERR